MSSNCEIENISKTEKGGTSDDENSLPCWDCNINFSHKYELYKHLELHIKQPIIKLSRIQLPSLKITLKHKSHNSFEIVTADSGKKSPNSAHKNDNLEESNEPSEIIRNDEHNNDEQVRQSEEEDGYHTGEIESEGGSNDFSIGDESESFFGENFEKVDTDQLFQDDQTYHDEQNPLEDDHYDEDTSHLSAEQEHEVPMEQEEAGEVSMETAVEESIMIPTADTSTASPQAPVEEPVDVMPKIRIKTTGLLKDTVTITEILDDDDDDISKRHNWETTSSLEDPLKISDSDDILSLINNNAKAKDFGFTSSDSEFMPLDQLESTSNNALQPLCNNQNPFGSIAGLPMEALAQQVSRLQPNANGMHQQNVLINIQQFPQPNGPPHPGHYHQPSHLYHPPPQPMYHPSAYQPYPQPPNLYYPPPRYAPMPPPPPGQPQMPPRLTPMPHPYPPVSQPQPPPYRQPHPAMARLNAPRQQQPIQQHPRMQTSGRHPAPRGQMMASRQPPPLVRQRMQQPNIMPRQPIPGSGRGGMAVNNASAKNVRNNIRPGMRMPGLTQQQQQQQQQFRAQAKRTQPQQQDHLNEVKRRKFDVLTPEKDDDDCQVICMQPRNTDGGLPQIQSVQGATPDASDPNIMHLSDSITLSVRNPQNRPSSPKKSDAKAVANILATRGITVTTTPKQKSEKVAEPAASKSPTLPSLNLNGAVSIIPSSKSNTSNHKQTNQLPSLPTVDLTNDSATNNRPPPQKNANMQPPKQQNQRGLPFRCDLCPAQYPNAVGLSKHRQNFHKTMGGTCELGVPLVNLNQPGIFQKLSALGINNYIPLQAPGPGGMYALPIINMKSRAAVSAMNSTQILTLGPVRNIPAPRPNGATPQQKMSPNQQKK